LGGDYLIHDGLKETKIVYFGDIEALAREYLIALGYESDGVPYFDITPLGFKYYEHLEKKAGESNAQVESTMLKKYRQRFTEIIKSKSYEMGLFEIDENPSGEKVLVICVPKTQLRFEITQNPENFHEFCCLFTKFAPVASDYGQAPTNGWASIEAIYSWFEFWLDNEIKVYVEEYEVDQTQLSTTQARQNKTIDIEVLLNKGEKSDLEVKGSVMIDLNRLYKGDGLQESKPEIALEGVLKTIASFLNSSGGTTVIGAVEKSKFPELKEGDYPEINDYYLVGIEIELDKSGVDGYELKLRSLINDHIGRHLAGVISIESHRLENSLLCVLKVPRVLDNWYYIDGKKFYVRDGNRTIMLQGEEADRYKSRFKRN